MFTLPVTRQSLWDSFQDLERLFDDMSTTVSTLRHQEGSPGGIPVNVWSTPDGLVVSAEVPGMTPEDVAISVLDSTLTIRGRREGREDLTRTMQLPYRVDADHTEARCKDGILTLALRRHEAEKPRRIAITAS